MQVQKRHSEECRFRIWRKWEGSIIFFAAAAGTTAAGAGTTAGIGAANTLFTAFLCLIDKETGATDDGQNHGNHYIVDRIHRLITFRSLRIPP